MNQCDYITRPRVRLVGQPLSLGLIMILAGGILCLVMADAFDIREHWALSLATVIMGAGSFWLLLAGLRSFFATFQQVRISPDALVVTLFGIPLRRIPAEKIYSITASTRAILLRSKERELHRLTVNISGTGAQAEPFWLDWSLDTEEALKEKLPHVNFLF